MIAQGVLLGLGLVVAVWAIVDALLGGLTAHEERGDR